MASPLSLRLCCILISSLLTPSLLAALLPFYQATDSEFASGRMPLSQLQRNFSEQFVERFHKLKIGNVDYWVKEDESLSLPQLARFVECRHKAPLYRSRNRAEAPQRFCSMGERFLVLQSQNQRFRLREASGRIAWADVEDFQWPARENGRAYFPEASYIRSPQTGKRFWIEAKTRLDVLYFRGEQVYFSYQGEVLALDTNKVISFKNFIGAKAPPINKKAVAVQIHKAFPLSPYQATLYLHKEQELYGRQKAQWQKVSRLSQGQFALSQRHKDLFWNVSQIKRHGRVHWREDLSEPISLESLSSTELLDRKIFDMAASPLDPSLKLAAAQGLFLKRGQSPWQKLSHFGNQNLPIHFAKKGRLFVGAYYSDDEGKNFRSYLPLGDLLHKSSHRQKLGPIQVLEIRSLDPRGRRIRVQIRHANQQQWLDIDVEHKSLQKIHAKLPISKKQSL